MKRWIAQATQVIGVSGLLAAGVAFTIFVEYPQWRQPGELVVPPAVVHASEATTNTWRLASVLRAYTKDEATADRIAGAIVNEGQKRDLDPALLVGVLLTEDITLDTMAKSHVGATGLMQVMPFHKGKWGCSSTNLYAIESNICHGAGVLQDAMRRASSTRVALLRYNGCVNGTNTPGCHSYPDRVLRVANKATAQMLATAQ